ncbi:hypothetical protein VTO73DRAFT_7071 [Trametes versicolor]
MILLTKDACCRLRDAADDEILTARPLVRVLVIEARAFNRGGGYQVFVTDGQGYAHIAIAPVLAQKLGSGLHIGTVIRLLQATRNPADDPCSVKVECAEITYAGMHDVETDGSEGPELDEALIRVTGDRQDVIQARNERDEERRRRRLLEYVMKVICRDLALGHKGGIPPRLVEMIIAMLDSDDSEPTS